MTPFSIEKEAEQSPGGAITSDRRLYLTADEKTAVEEGDERARFLLAAPGHSIKSADVTRLGLTVADGKVVLPTPEEPATKSKGETKERKPGENK